MSFLVLTAMMTMALILLWCDDSYSASISLGELSLPEYPGSIEAGGFEMVLNGEEMDTAMGVVDGNRLREVIDFYRNILTQRGWKGEKIDMKGFLRALFMVERGTQPSHEVEERLLKSMESWNFSKDQKVLCLWAYEGGVKEGVTHYMFFLSRLPRVQFFQSPETTNTVRGIPSEDAPGSDPRDIPRYPGSVRESSVSINNGKIQYFGYVTSARVENVLSFYEGVMKRNGWKGGSLAPFFNEEDTAINVYSKGHIGAYLVVSTSPQEEGMTRIFINVMVSETSDDSVPIETLDAFGF